MYGLYSRAASNQERPMMAPVQYLSYAFLIQPLLEARAEIQKYFRWFFGFLVLMKSLEFAFEMN